MEAGQKSKLASPRSRAGKQPVVRKAAKRELSHRERVKLFVEHYKKSGDLSAAIVFSRLSRGQARDVIETHPELREDINLTLARAGATPERVIKEICNIALCDPRQLVDEEGRMRPMHEWPEEVARAVSGFDLTQRSHGEDEDQVNETTYKPRFWDKPQMLKELVRMLKLVSPEMTELGMQVANVQKIEVVIVAPGQAQAVGPVGLLEG